MRNTVALPGLILKLTIVLIVSTSCGSRSEPPSPTAAGNVTQLPPETATPTPAPTSTAVPTPLSPNVALSGTVRVSSGEESVQNAIDGDPDTVWSSENYSAQWIAIALDDLYLVERLELVVAQTPAGLTTHVLWVDNGSGVRTRFQQLTDIHTEDGQTLTIEINSPRTVKEVLVHTLDSPSWVAWREVRIFGSPLSPQNESGTTPQLRLEKILDQLVLPVQITHAGDGSGRIFVVEQHGRISIVKNGVANETLFLDISDRVNCCQERGLFNVAFPPAFSSSKGFYLSYSNSNDDTVISRFATTEDPDVADPSSEEILLTVEQPHSVHNGGRLAFGPRDGYLYVGMGDGGSDGPPAHFSQDPTILLGKILRIDVESEIHPYEIPAGNPFIAVEGFRDEIWALGLRNPWGFAFDDQTGELFIPDTGHNDREELNFQPASSVGGENYGWPTIEGTRCLRFQDLPVPCRQAGIFASPVAEYDHTRGCAIVGGVVYRGSELPHLSGRFLFSDFCRGDIWSLQKREPVIATGSMQESRSVWHSELLLSATVPVSSIGEDEEGNVYTAGFQDGSIYMITSK